MALSRRDRPAKEPLSREAVVTAALKILKKDGLAKVTMRSIAAELETGPASLYVYVRDTQDLHAQILGALLKDLPAPKPGPNWKKGLFQVTEAYLEVLLRYPEMARMTMSSHATDENSLRLLDVIASLLMAGGMSTRNVAWGIDLITAYVVATAVEHAGDTDDLDELKVKVSSQLDAKKHPHLVKLGMELVSGEGLERFRWGLEVLINGLLKSK